uniref:Uncharacterized protein n=1 Tax=viral metagenome TaxID=1070528 RepID=A0A6C0KJA3_9ZZZZ
MNKKEKYISIPSLYTLSLNQLFQNTLLNINTLSRELGYKQFLSFKKQYILSMLMKNEIKTVFNMNFQFIPKLNYQYEYFYNSHMLLDITNNVTFLFKYNNKCQYEIVFRRIYENCAEHMLYGSIIFKSFRSYYNEIFAIYYFKINFNYLFENRSTEQIDEYFNGYIVILNNKKIICFNKNNELQHYQLKGNYLPRSTFLINNLFKIVNINYPS